MNHMIKKELESSAATISQIDAGQVMSIARSLVAVFRSGGKVVIFGNGGSAADAQHLAAEFSGRYLIERPPLRAIALTNISAITAIGNDYSFEDIFLRNVEGLVSKGDAVIGISTSGNSKNVLRAMKKAREMGAVTIAFTGNKGALKDEVDLALTIPSGFTPRIQEGYMAAGHVICGLVERSIYARKAVFVDRDDTIVKDVPYCSRPEDLRLFPGVGEGIKRLNDAGFLVIIITNQSGVARGFFSEQALQEIHKKLLEDIGKAGGKVDAIYHCPHHPDQGCNCRKPNPGMVERALEDFAIDLSRSYIIGDSEHEVELGKRLEIKSFRVKDENGFAEAVEKILAEND